MFETSKAIARRSHDHRYATRYFTGDGVDIGAGEDSIGNYRSLFPLMGEVKAWDVADGDAMLMRGVADERFNFVHSSHCLEHLQDPDIALGNWIRICKRGGYLILVIPDEDLYEQGVWPSTFNADHRWSFTIGKQKSWCPRSVNVIDLLQPWLLLVSVLKIELLDMNYIYGLDQRVDQSRTLTGEAAIEVILRRHNV